MAIFPDSPSTWTLCAVCPKSGFRQVIMAGTEAEMDAIFGLLVRCGHGLQLRDAAGVLRSASLGAIAEAAPAATDQPEDNGDAQAPPEAINRRTLQLDFPPGTLAALTDRIASLEQITATTNTTIGRRLNAIEQTNTTIARRLYAIERKQSEDREIREAYQADQARRLSGLEKFTTARLDALAELVAMRHDETVERLGALEESTAPTDHLLDRLNALADLLADHERRVCKLEENRLTLEDLAKANAERLDALARRIEDLTTATNRDALSFAASVGATHRKLKGYLDDLRHDIDNLREAAIENHKAHANQLADLRRDLETLAAQVDATAQAVATRAQPPATDADETPLDRLRLLEVEFADSLGEISRIRKQSLDTANAVSKLVAGLLALGR